MMNLSNYFSRRSVSALLTALCLTVLCGATAFAQTTAFTYQGRLSDGANAANGQYDMRFRLYDSPTLNTGTQSGGDVVFSTTTNGAVTVSNGVFIVRLDFGSSPFAAGAARFLEIAVKKSSDSAYTTLNPRQPLMSSPYAIRTLNATAADRLSPACVACVTNGQINSIDGTKVSGTVANALNAENALNATNATSANTANTATTAENVSGIVGIANGGTGSHTKNFVDLMTDQTVGGNKTFTGVLNGDGSGLRNISGANVAGSTTLNPQRLAILRWYDVNQATIARPITVGSLPQALAFDGTFVYAANASSNNVTRIRASTGTVEGTITVGRNPHALAFDGTFVYVANSGSDSVMRF